jgi:hypothetical protein
LQSASSAKAAIHTADCLRLGKLLGLKIANVDLRRGLREALSFEPERERQTKPLPTA